MEKPFTVSYEPPLGSNAGANAISKFYGSKVKLLWNKTLWLVVAIHKTSLNQFIFSLAL